MNFTRFFNKFFFIASKRYSFLYITTFKTIATQMLIWRLFEIAMNRTSNYYFCFIGYINNLTIIIFISINFARFFNKYFGCYNITFIAFITIHMIARKLFKITVNRTSNYYFFPCARINNLTIIIFIPMNLTRFFNKFFSSIFRISPRYFFNGHFKII